MKNTIIFATVIILAGIAGFAAQQYLSSQENTSSKPDPVLGQPRLEFAINDLEGELRNIKEWDGKVILLNFWATWCPPCKREIPAFIELQEKYAQQGFQIIGVAIDDPDSVQDYADTMGINYPVLPGNLGAIEISRKYGNRIDGLPYSVFINREGIVTHTINGELTKTHALEILNKLGITTG